MATQKKKGAVIKGLAFPIGYFIFMNVGQTLFLLVYAAFLFMRDVFFPVLSASNDIAHFLQLMASPDVAEYLSYTLLMEIASTPAYLASVFTSLLAVVILWFVFNRKNRSAAKYFHFKPAPVRSIFAAIFLGFGLYFLVNAVLTVIMLISDFLVVQVLIPFMQEMCSELVSLGEYELAQELHDLVQIIDESYSLSNSLGIMPDLGWFTLAAIVLAPLVEELVFRAGAINNLKQKLPVFVSILISSILFSLAHIGSLNVWQLIYTFILGIFAGYLLVKSESIYPAIICHFCFNGANLISLIVYEVLGLQYVVESGNDMFYGGPIQIITPDAGKLVDWYESFSIIFTILTALLSIPMLIVGIILLCSLHKKKPKQQALDQAKVIEVNDTPSAPFEQAQDSPFTI